MALTAFCTVCQRTVYLDEADTPVCPVCSSPLLEAVDAGDERPVDQHPADERPADESVQ